jgi:hypothetical protein
MVALLGYGKIENFDADEAPRKPVKSGVFTLKNC